MDDEEVLQKTLALASPWLRNDELEVSRYVPRYAAAAVSLLLASSSGGGEPTIIMAGRHCDKSRRSGPNKAIYLTWMLACWFSSGAG